MSESFRKRFESKITKISREGDFQSSTKAPLQFQLKENIGKPPVQTLFKKHEPVKKEEFSKHDLYTDIIYEEEEEETEEEQNSFDQIYQEVEQIETKNHQREKTMESVFEATGILESAVKLLKEVSTESLLSVQRESIVSQKDEQDSITDQSQEEEQSEIEVSPNTPPMFRNIPTWGSVKPAPPASKPKYYFKRQNSYLQNMSNLSIHSKLPVPVAFSSPNSSAQSQYLFYRKQKLNPIKSHNEFSSMSLPVHSLPFEQQSNNYSNQQSGQYASSMTAPTPPLILNQRESYMKLMSAASDSPTYRPYTIQDYRIFQKHNISHLNKLGGLGPEKPQENEYIDKLKRSIQQKEYDQIVRRENLMKMVMKPPSAPEYGKRRNLMRDPTAEHLEKMAALKREAQMKREKMLYYGNSVPKPKTRMPETVKRLLEKKMESPGSLESLEMKYKEKTLRIQEIRKELGI